MTTVTGGGQAGGVKALLEAIVEQRHSIERLMRVLSRAVWHELMEEK